jgi:sigma-B regulation protein RsbU (phosphoserine phosphatase)
MYAGIVTAIIFAFIVFGAVTAVIGFYNFNREFREENAVSTYRMADAAASQINGDHIGDYLDGLRKEEYGETERSLDDLCEKLNVSLIYVIQVDRSDYGRFISVFNSVNNSVDDTSYTRWELGHKRDTTNDEYRQKYKAVYEQGSLYETVYREKTTDGQHPHITTLVPVKDSSGEVTAILCMQRPVREIIDAAMPYLGAVALSTLLLAAVASLIAAAYIRDGVIEPVRKVSEETVRFANENRKGEPLGEISGFTELQELAGSIDSMETDMVRYMDELTAVASERQRIEAELSLAYDIQKDSLPDEYPAFPDRKEFGLFAVMSPARGVGGDFYNYFLLDDDRLLILIGDVSGKGIPGAMFMTETNILLSDRAREGGSPAEILAHVNKGLCEHNKAQMFVSVWLGILQISTGRLTACNAGHEYPFLKQPGMSYELLKDRHGLVMAAMEDTVFRDYVIQLHPGAKLFLYTDGVPEATDVSGEMFGTERMAGSLNRDGAASPEDTLKNMLVDIDEFVSGSVQFDDLAMLCLEYRGKEDAAEMTVSASVDRLDDVQRFIEEKLEEAGCPQKEKGQIRLAAEEIFVNISRYAYPSGNGEVKVTVDISGQPAEASVTFTDTGIPFDPLSVQDPDTTLPAEQRKTGGLGIFLARRMMDDVLYEYREGQNILTLKKRI